MARKPINVAASIVADVSAGIYRSPAGALKELISNAFDADATNIRISTGAPNFKTFTCTDDGLGITPERFQFLMTQLGGSSKRDQGELSPLFHRPLVGRIGIGLLSIAQICKHFSVISSTKGSAKKFRANIDLEPFLLAEARRFRLGETLETSKGTMKIGEYDIEEADEAQDAHYTRIIMEKIEPGFRKRLTDVPQKRGGFSPKTFSRGTMEDFLDVVEGGTVAEHGAYAQMIWELAATSPVEYFDSDPILGHEAADTAQVLDMLRGRMRQYGFKAYVDGVELRRPIRLPPKPARPIEHRFYPLAFDATLSDNRKLAVRGYLYWQQGRILPRELQGVLVRVRNVAIGPYDATYMGYPHHEGWKFSQMTGELYVDEGLDQAVNIDRASFRESDEAYIDLQSFLFEKLKGGTDEGLGIFTSIKRDTKEISKKFQEQKDRRRERVTAKLITGRTSKPLNIQSVPETTAPASGVAIDHHDIKVDEDLLDRVPKKHRRLFLAVCGIIESEISESVRRGRRRALYEKLAALLSEF